MAVVQSTELSVEIPESLDEIAKRANEEHSLAQAEAQSATGHAIRCGLYLVAARAQKKYGEWLPWVEGALAFGDDMALRYMHCAEWALSNPDLCRDFDSLYAIEKAMKAEKAESKQKAKADLAETIKAEPAPLPDGPFRVIVIDPPWKYESRVEDKTHRGRNQYPDMTVEEICDLPVGDRAHEDCVLWLWTTNAFMSEAYECLDAWGFTAKTILTWDKVNFGLGDWLRNVTEHCILAVRGKPIVTLTNQTTLIEEKRREHSRKPEGFYKLVEDLCPCPNKGRLEIFQRTKRKGWQGYGAEKEHFSNGE